MRPRSAHQARGRRLCAILQVAFPSHRTADRRNRVALSQFPMTSPIALHTVVALLLQGPATASAGGHADEFLPHGFCFLWNRPLLWTHVSSDILIGLAYLTISFSLGWLVYRARRDIPFSSAFVMFGLFIVTCGLTHLLEVVTFWNPVYRLLGGVKVVTALASVATAATMPFLIPRVHGTIRDARASREHEIAAARADVLEQSNAELVRVNALLQVALDDAEHARRTAEAANRVKADFLAVMSHELRTPLNAVIGYTELLALGVTGPVTKEQIGQLDRIGDSARHLVQLIDQILHFARIEAGQETLVLEEFDAAAAVRDTVELVRPLAEQRGLALAVGGGSEGQVVVTSDARLTRQAVINLLSNAIKYTPTGSIDVMIEGVNSEGLVAIHVRDTGIGIATEHHPHIFEPFWQAASARTRVAGGTGLGLSVTKHIADRLGGRLAFESTPGVGSTFSLFLPVIPPGGDAAEEG